MAAVDVPEASTGFSFELCKRNELLKGKGVEPMPFKKTGTTIAGVLFKDGVVLGADTRATADTVVADKNCAKIHYLTENMRCCGAGTAADTEHLLANMSSRLKLHRYATGRGSRVITALSMLKSVLFQYQGHISAALILGGVDLKGPQLFTVFPHGSSDNMPFATMGSGSLNAMAVFETDYRDNMSREEAMALVTRAIRGGIFNDLGSGSNVDLCVITKDGTENLRNYEYLQGKTYQVQFPIDLTMRPAEVTKAKEFPSLDKVTITEGEPDEHAMDTS